MKKKLMLAAILLICVTLASADDIQLYGGAGTMVEYPKYGAVYHFQFFGNYPHLINAFNTESLEDRAGIQMCEPCADPTKFSVLLYNSSNAPAEGLIRFDAVSYTSALLPNGNLKVTFTTIADLSLYFQGHHFYWDPDQPWIVTTIFRKDKYHGWDFRKATFGGPNQLLPEPASFLLLGTGILLLVRKRRARA